MTRGCQPPWMLPPVLQVDPLRVSWQEERRREWRVNRFGDRAWPVEDP